MLHWRIAEQFAVVLSFKTVYFYLIGHFCHVPWLKGLSTQYRQKSNATVFCIFMKVSMIGPSPDWIVGISSLELYKKRIAIGWRSKTCFCDFELINCMTHIINLVYQNVFFLHFNEGFNNRAIAWLDCWRVRPGVVPKNSTWLESKEIFLYC